MKRNSAAKPSLILKKNPGAGKLRFPGLLLCIALMISLCGCETGTGLLGTAEEGKTRTVTSNTISIPSEQIRTLNPVVAKDEDAYYINKLIYQGLFELDETLAPRGVLAGSYHYGEDGASMTVELKRNILWQDGTPFTAADVKFSIEAYLAVRNTGKSLYDSYVENIKSVKVVDEHTVQIVYANPLNVAVENLIFPIIPASTAKRPQDVQKLADGFFPVGTGPYLVDSFQSETEILLAGNPHYSGIVPTNRIDIKFIPGKAEAVNLFEIREIDLSFLKEADRDTMIKNTAIKVLSFPSNEIEVLGFNFRHGALQDKKVRHAIICAIDRENILKTCYLNNGILHPSLYYPEYLGVQWQRPDYSYDPERGGSQMKEAGYSGLSLRLLVNGEDKARNLTAQMIKSDLEKMGVSVTLSVLNWEDYSKALAAGDYDLFIGGYRIRETYDLRPLLHSAHGNPIGYSNPILDILLDKMQSAVTPEEKRQQYEAVEKVLAEELPYYCILHKTYGLAVSDDLQGEPAPQFNHIYKGCESFSLSYEISEKE